MKLQLQKQQVGGFFRIQIGYDCNCCPIKGWSRGEKGRNGNLLSHTLPHVLVEYEFDAAPAIDDCLVDGNQRSNVSRIDDPDEPECKPELFFEFDYGWFGATH